MKGILTVTRRLTGLPGEALVTHLPTSKVETRCGKTFYVVVGTVSEVEAELLLNKVASRMAVMRVRTL